MNTERRRYIVQFVTGTLADKKPLKRAWIIEVGISHKDAMLNALRGRIKRYEKVSRNIVCHVTTTNAPMHKNGMPMICTSFEINIEPE